MSSIETTLNATRSNVRTFGLSWPLLVAVAALVGILGKSRVDALLRDADTYWHLATGRWILEHAAVPQNDPFSHSMPGAAWTAHEWLSEVVLAGVFQVAGWPGLVVGVVLVFAATLAYLTRFLLARMEPAHALLFTALAAGMLMGHLLARPHVLVWPLLALWVGALVNAVEDGRSPSWWLLALLVLWANLHGSFTLGLALAAALAVEAVSNCTVGQRRAMVWRWAKFLGLAVVAAMITPSGWQGLWYPVQVTNMTFALDVIQEWRSPDFHKFQIIELWLMLLLAIACSGRVRLPLLRLILVLGLAHLALKHQRHIAVLGLVAPFLMASPLASQWRATRGAGGDVKSVDRIFAALASPARWGAVVAAAILTTLLIGSGLQAGRFTPASATTPEAAVNAAIQSGVAGPVLNSYNFGGYLIYRGVPVFIDGRADIYGDALLERYIQALQLETTDKLPDLLADYRIAWTLLEPGTPAVALLDRLPGWRRIHSDEIAVVHVHDGGATP
ncbi:hypothetical protein [Thauera aromatica]|uniref:hypothetical protein n=1 Tax=Thauera aromatica TaxID=59405 RepID=UPI001FFC6E99|nr:hypothetical protein [Thauera aromatica]MCK2097707.1 hypothetical protein [Thauera aromatica]